MGLTSLDLRNPSGEARFLAAAEAIGHTLNRRQRPNGIRPFRVDPNTEKVIEEYTSSVIFAVMRFEKLDTANGNDHYVILSCSTSSRSRKTPPAGEGGDISIRTTIQ